MLGGLEGRRVIVSGWWAGGLSGDHFLAGVHLVECLRSLGGLEHRNRLGICVG